MLPQAFLLENVVSVSFRALISHQIGGKLGERIFLLTQRARALKQVIVLKRTLIVDDRTGFESSVAYRDKVQSRSSGCYVHVLTHHAHKPSLSWDYQKNRFQQIAANYYVIFPFRGPGRGQTESFKFVLELRSTIFWILF